MRARPMRILFLTTDLSYPPQDGRMLRTYNVLRGLAGRHSVHLVCFDQRHGEDPDERRRVAEARLRELCTSVDVFEVPSKRSKLSLAWTGAQSLVEPLPFSSRVYRSRAALRTLKALAASQPMDVLHVENTLLGDHVTGLPALGRVLMHHNVESDLFRQRAASDRFLPRRVFTRLEASKMRRFEQRMGPRFGAHIVCSSGDAERLSAIIDGARICVVPNGVDLAYFSPRAASSAQAMNAVHVGGLNWAPNLHGARWLVEDVWPRVRRSVADATLAFVGRTGDAPISRWNAQAGVRCLGEVDDVRPFYAGAALSVVPVHVGGGTRLKILNSWAMGTPVVSTTKGCEGLAARPDEHLLVADTPEAFAAAVVRLLREPGLREALGAAGRRLVEAEYGWPRIVEQTERAYQQARDDSTAARSC
jgi:glycosyltransferase involved in cell wall biosynthesis